MSKKGIMFLVVNLHYASNFPMESVKKVTLTQDALIEQHKQQWLELLETTIRWNFDSLEIVELLREAFKVVVLGDSINPLMFKDAQNYYILSKAIELGDDTLVEEVLKHKISFKHNEKGELPTKQAQDCIRKSLGALGTPNYRIKILRLLQEYEHEQAKKIENEAKTHWQGCTKKD